jgi:hypothetical protein
MDRHLRESRFEQHRFNPELQSGIAVEQPSSGIAIAAVNPQIL